MFYDQSNATHQLSDPTQPIWEVGTPNKWTQQNQYTSGSQDA